MKGNIAATALVVLGIWFLGRNLGWFTLNVVELLSTWWPLLLIAVGIGMFAMPKERMRSTDSKDANS